MKSNWYSISDMIELASKEFSLPDSASNNYYTEFQRAIKEMGLWENAHIEIRGKSKTHVFTEEQMQRVFASKRIYNYLRELSLDEAIRTRPRYDDIKSSIVKRRDNFIKKMDELSNEYVDGKVSIEDRLRGVSMKDFLELKQRYMIEAIFRVFFSDFNNERLYHDLEVTLYTDEMNLTPVVLEAEHRLEHPEGNYYTRKDT